MSRTTAEALALVNWKGVFYARYGLDRHVTALEGANGAGKTTVMIAAYVVLLPDMSRLRFTNLGETGATGGDKGIWGRLGESGRPSYAVVEFRCRESADSSRACTSRGRASPPSSRRRSSSRGWKPTFDSRSCCS
jgi:chromosome condensin MukBEF ATPase and DNA-binding subunit MukB